MGVDISELKAIRQRIQTELDSPAQSQFIRDCTNELALRLLRKARKRTPTGKYPKGSGKVGGTLKREWDIGEITQAGSTYSVEIINPTRYAPYVEYGHRTRGGNGWVEGKFMLTISENEIRDLAPRLLKARLEKRLREIFNG